MSNQIEINPAQLEAEAIAIAASAPVDELQPQPAGEGGEVVAQQPTPEQIKKGYTVILTTATMGVAQMLAPNWAVQPEEATELSDAMAEALLLWFPDQVIPPKYLAAFNVAWVGLKIVAARRDKTSGKLKPLHAEPVEATGDNKNKAS